MPKPRTRVRLNLPISDGQSLINLLELAGSSVREAIQGESEPEDVNVLREFLQDAERLTRVVKLGLEVGEASA